jgi:enoyl-CoA hydratase/carnithine racemase
VALPRSVGRAYMERLLATGIKIDGIEFSELSLVDRPVHAAVLGRIFTSWSLIESSITALLGLMMHDDHRAALAILESFRNNSSRVEAVRRIGKKVLDASLRQHFDDLMKDVISYAKERNSIAHGLWGSHEDEHENVYRMSIEKFSTFVVESPNITDIDAEVMLDSFKKEITVFTVDDLKQLEQKGIDLLCRVMGETTNKAYSQTSRKHVQNS